MSHGSPAIGGVDCGLFTLAYAIDLFTGLDPSVIFYDQSAMRDHLMFCLTNKVIQRFPIHKESCISQPSKEVTHNVPATQKWVTPKRTTRHMLNVKISPVRLTNRFTSLTEDMEDNEGNNNIHTQNSERMDGIPSSPRPHNNSSANTPLTTSSAESQPAQSQDFSKKSSVIKNLTHNPYRPLSKDEIAVLELGLSFSPSKRFYNKEKLTEDLYWFIRKLKLKEFFFERKHPHTGTEDLSGPETSDTVSDHQVNKWEEANSDWYPEEVRNNRSDSLSKFIKGTLSDIKNSLNNKSHKIHNNLDNKKREALEGLNNDTSIVIKQSDKCGSIVIMNTRDYEEECYKHLRDSTFYEEVAEDPNPFYSDRVQEECKKLKDDGHISDKQYDTLTANCKTPSFYGLPKMHKVFDKFPALRPICSGTASPTAKLSQFVDSFLKPVAQCTASYIKDTTHFILRTRDIKLKTDNNEVFLATMDVSSLYPNIDHTEGTNACSSYLDKHQSSCVPSSTLKTLIKLILQSNTMCFKDRFYHQIKGTAMGTGMAVNYANLFMAKLEEDMLDSYYQQTGLRPSVWFRFIDDIFFIWQGDENSLRHFLLFCNQFSDSQNMKSSIKFTYSYSATSVNFLDTTVSLAKDGTLLTDLYAKPTAAYQYLHQSSYHDPHLIRAIPKSQFIRIRRICSSLETYWVHANKYITYFGKRGYSVSRLQATATDIGARSREEFLFPTQISKTERIPLIMTYHHKFREVSQILHKNYSKMVTDTPNLQKVFPEPPMVAFRRNTTIKDKVVTSKHWVRATYNENKKSHVAEPFKDRTTIKNLMNTSKVIENKQNGHKCKLPNGKPTDKNVVYAVECLKHSLIYVGATTNPLNCRINRHRSDITNYPERCELPKHFHNNNCDFKTDIRISVLEHVTGTLSKLKRQEDKWVTRLGTLSPGGLNASKSEFGSIYNALFK